jgi:two-component system chemotaxis response regulator CheB
MRINRRHFRTTPAANEMAQPSQGPVRPRLIGIVSATGGIEALTEILGNLPREFAVPILLYPCIHPDYLDSLAARLDAKSPLRVAAAGDEQVPEPGSVYLAPGDACLLIVEGRVQLARRNRDDMRRAKDVFFCSLAADRGSAAVAVILSASDKDGAEGMKAVREAGGYTIVQDRSTSVVYGPAEIAIRLGAVCESRLVQEIAPKLVALAASALLTPR